MLGAAVKNGRKAEAVDLARVIAVRHGTYVAVRMGLAWLAYAMMSDDEAREELMAPGYSKDFSIKFVTPVGKIAIAQPYEDGALTAPFLRLADYMYAKHKGWDEIAERSFDDLRSTFSTGFLSFDPDMVAMSVAPLVEVMANYSFFMDRSILPDYEEDLDLDLRDTSRASALGRALQTVAQTDARYIDHLLRSFGGGWGRMATSRSGGELTKRTLGLSGETSPWHQRDVAWVLERAEGRGLDRKRYMRALRTLLGQIKGKDGRERDKAARKAYDFARRVREMMERQSTGSG